jgi:hypothetical protein
MERALEYFQVQEQERETARTLRRDMTRSILAAGDFARMRTVIPLWWEWVCTGLVYFDQKVEELIDRRLTETAGLQQAIIDDWA